MIRQILTSRRRIKKSEAKLIALLGLPTLGLALSTSVVVTFAPLVASKFVDDAIFIGLIIGAEGILALFLPVAIGHWSDQLHTRIGGRLPFVLVGGLLAALALISIGLAESLAMLVVSIIVFFLAYYIAYEPYRALYPDLISRGATARAQGVQALWRGGGTGLALIGGGPLIALSLWLPFVAAAAVMVFSISGFMFLILSRRGVPKQHRHRKEPLKEVFASLIRTMRYHRQIRSFIIANVLWELSQSALKTFIILYLTLGLGYTTIHASLAIALVAVFIVIGSPLSGYLADYFGRVRVMSVAAATFGACLLLPGLTSDLWLLLFALPLGSLAGATVLSLPYSLLIPMMHRNRHGRLTGLYSSSRGLGIMLGPITAGGLISIGSHWFLAHGYAGMWFVCGGSMLASLIFLKDLSD